MGWCIFTALDWLSLAVCAVFRFASLCRFDYRGIRGMVINTTTSDNTLLIYYQLTNTVATIPTIPVALVSAVLPAFWIAAAARFSREQRLRKKHPGRCAKCGYDLHGSKERCPECGTPIKNGA
jgi:predicted Zn-ribbon and HTH transcriptional regulator